VANLVILSNETHRDLRINNLVGSDYTRLNVISVVPREFPRLLAHYPIFFTKANDSGQHEPAVLLGFERGENLFLEGSGWDASYVPLQVQRQPFSLVPRQPDVAGGQPTSLDIAVDEASPLVSREAGERLFQDDGKATQYLSTVTSVLSTLVSGAREAYAFTAKLAELNLLEPVRVDVEFTDKSTAKLGGLYWIAGAVLKTLPADTLAELRDKEYLEWLYFQMASLSQMASLVARKNRRLNETAAASDAAKSNAGSA
jgi:hypothetical protein